MTMLIKLCFLLLSVGVYASYQEDGANSTNENADLFEQLDFIFPQDFLSKFPNETEFFRLKIVAYLFFSLFAQEYGKTEPTKVWSMFNKNDFNRVVIDAAFYEYLTNFADREKKPDVFNPLESLSSSQDTAIDRIGEYLDQLSTVEKQVDQPKIQPQPKAFKYSEPLSAECDMVPLLNPVFGIPGEHFPNFCSIPTTSFNCENKIIPGIYADLETGCQVFHACWPHRMDSFLCPIGTTFNQTLLTCDFWHDSNCSHSELLFEEPMFTIEKILAGNIKPIVTNDNIMADSDGSFSHPTELDIPDYDGSCISLISKPLQLNMKVLPVKCKVMELQPRKPQTVNDLIKTEEYLAIISNLFGNLTNALHFAMQAAELISKEQRHPSVKGPEFEKRPPVEFALDNDAIDSTSQATTEENSDQFQSAFKVTTQGKVNHADSVKSSAFQKPSKSLEETKKLVPDVIRKSLELGDSVLSDAVLPLMEKLAMSSHHKMYKTKP